MNKHTIAKSLSEDDAKCGACRIDDPDKTDWMECDGCHQWYHVLCQSESLSPEISSLVESLNTHLNNMPVKDAIKITFHCGSCRKVNSVVNKESSIIMDKLQEMAKDIQDIKDDKRKLMQTTSYAAVAKRSSGIVQNEQTYSVRAMPRVYPTVTLKTIGNREVNLKTLKEALKGDKDCNVNRIIDKEDGDIKIMCNDPVAISRVKEMAQVRGMFVCNETKRATPKIKIIGAELENTVNMSDLEVVEDIKARNGMDVKVWKRYVNKNSGTQTIIVEVNYQMQNTIMDAGFIYIGYQRLKVYEFLSVRRCGICLRFSHGTQDCKQKEKSCFKCGGAHLAATCNSPDKCINCCEKNLKLQTKIDVGHNTLSEKCQSFLELQMSIRRRTFQAQE